MANAIYPKYKEALISGSANIDLSGGTVKAVLVDSAVYTYSSAHQFFSSVASVIATATLAGKTVASGVFDSNDVTWTAVTGAQSEIIIIYIDTGSAATSRLVAYYDTSVTGLPVTPNGGDINVTVNASGWFSL
jgi:hypothetical protein